MSETVKKTIQDGKAVLGIEFGSTRIKAVLTDETHQPVAMGTWDWENRLEDNIWTYSLEDIWQGLQGCYKSLADDVRDKYGLALTKLAALGFSGMMHGYMPFDGAGELLVPFRTWRNTMTGEACKKLVSVFDFNIPQRWSIAHLHLPCRVCALEAFRGEGAGHRRGVRHVPHRFGYKGLRCEDGGAV